VAVDHDNIKRLLGEKEAPTDHSLRAKSLHRATAETVPTTLTPYEWEQWYAEHGVPLQHRTTHTGKRLSWWRRLFRLKG
jgi:hypothetical protein